jgi:hypothetical protein
MKRVALVLIIVGGALLYVGSQEMRLAAAAKSTPQTLTCAELAAKGPGDNAHVILTDFQIGQNFIYQTSGRSNSAWEVVYLPAMPMPAASSTLRVTIEPEDKPSVIIKSGNIRSQQELLTLGSRVQGVVINKIAALGQKEKALLAESYPRASIENCWILEQDRHPASSMKILALTVGGLGLAALGVWLLPPRRRQVV